MSTKDGRTSYLEFAGLQFRGLTRTQLYPTPGQFKFVVTVNADFIVESARNPRFRGIISTNYATFDGQIPFWLAKLLGRPRGTHIEKISGSDFAYELIRFAKENSLRLFLLGASPEVNQAAGEIIKKNYGIAVRGYSPPVRSYPFQESWTNEILTILSDFRPEIIMVALGAPKQEYWIDDNKTALEEMGVMLAIGCGGTLDFISGRAPRAPVWAQKSGLEGIYRFVVEPRWFRFKRLFRSVLVFPIALYQYVRGRAG